MRPSMAPPFTLWSTTPRRRRSFARSSRRRAWGSTASSRSCRRSKTCSSPPWKPLKRRDPRRPPAREAAADGPLMNWQRVRSIIRKEIAQIFRDRRTLTSILMLPVIQLALYGYLSYEVLHQPTALWDQSQTAESRTLVSAFENTRYFSVRFRAGSMAEIEREIDGGKATAGIVIPPDYGALVRAGRPAAILVIVDASNATTSGAVLSAAAGVGTRISQDLLVRTVERRGQRVPAGIVDVRTRAWYNPDLKSRIFIVPGVL